MAKESFVTALGFRKLGKVSFGLILSLFLLFAIFNAGRFVPEGQEIKYALAFLGYGILGSYTFAREDFSSKLSKISLIKSLPIFIFSFILFYFLIGILLNLYNPLPTSLLTGLVAVPLSVQLINSLIFSVVETSFFQVFLHEKIGIFGSVLSAGIFHIFVWNGSILINFIGASFLFLIFSLFYYYTEKKFGLIAVVLTIAFHGAYNMVRYVGVYG